ncbi:DUF4369 domain-containing protein [Pedobacter sp. BMA]|uniref:DUF4369 domain-containing protein n=1 Tax=Pedobacter sp. BMA TaxID=1663685 RepID=UPI000649B0D5|nr:DUF4369 domain-containing protein [Pedobacter sp. BMA]KLT66721.1 hypothetical protein AB669_06030 [Pedobacter sp. BMA]
MNILKSNIRLTLTFGLLLVSAAAFSQNEFTIKGQLSPEINGKKILLTYKNNGVSVEDSTMAEMGKFTFKGLIGDPAYARISVNPPAMTTMQNIKSLDVRDFFIDAGEIVITSSAGAKTATVKGGKTQADYQRRFDLYKPVQARVDSLNNLIAVYKESGNTKAMDAARLEMNAEFAKTAKIDSNFIRENPGSFLSLDIWRSKHRGTLRSNFAPEFQKFSPAVRNTFAGKEIQAKFDLAKKLAPGQLAPDFKLKDTAGREVSLSSLRGKNVFVCFYTPDFMNYDAFTFNLGRINRALKDKNTVMVTVYYSYANRQDSYWMETIKRSNFSWLNLNDIGGVNDAGSVSPTAKAYGLTYYTLPSALLIGADGKILASQLKLNDIGLGQELAQLIK